MRVWGVAENGKILMFAPTKHAALDAAVGYEVSKPHYRTWLAARGMEDDGKSKLAYFEAMGDGIEFLRVTVTLRDIKPLVCIGLQTTSDDIQSLWDEAQKGK
jgi:hypothetical protein